MVSSAQPGRRQEWRTPPGSATPGSTGRATCSAIRTWWRDRWRSIYTPTGPAEALLPPPVIAGYTPPMGAIPGLGEHTDAVLAEFGLTELEIAALRESAAIGPSYISPGPTGQ